MPTYKSVSESRFGTARWDDEQITDLAGRLEIKLTDDGGTQLRVIFDAFLSYRKIDEGDAFKILRDIANTSTLGCNLFLVGQSDFLHWFNDQSESIHQSQAKHYWLTTLNSVIDVISLNPPQVQSP